MMHRTGIALALVGLLLLGGCEPKDRRPGLWLAGETSAEWPADWSFADEHPEIFIQVATPHLLPHSVTIWCASVDGALYLGARAPEDKRWPGWVDRRPEVRLKIDGVLYPARLEPLTEAPDIEPVAEAFVRKYRPSGMGGGEVSQRYWQVLPQS